MLLSESNDVCKTPFCNFPYVVSAVPIDLEIMGLLSSSVFAEGMELSGM
jgi:hypothetical protein